jgi:hypothetical protein
MTEEQRAEYLLKQREARQQKRVVVNSIKKPVTCSTINFNTQLSQSTVSATNSDNKIQNLIPSLQTGCASPGKHLKSTFVFLCKLRYIFHVF